MKGETWGAVVLLHPSPGSDRMTWSQHNFVKRFCRFQSQLNILEKHMGCAARWAVFLSNPRRLLWSRCSSRDQVIVVKAETPFPYFNMCSRGQHNKRPALKQGPDLYLEPERLRCWHSLRCTPHNKMLIQTPSMKSTLLFACSIAAGIRCIDQATLAQQNWDVCNFNTLFHSRISPWHTSSLCCPQP